MLKKIIKYIPGVAVPMGINFLLTMLYARYLSPGQYGILNIYLTTILIVYSFTLNIFQTACLRFYSLKLHNTESEFISTYVFSNIFTTFLIIPFSLIVNLFLSFDWWIIVLAVGANGLYQFLCNYYRVINSANKYNVDRLISSVSALVLLIVFSRIISPLSFIWPLVAVYGSYLFIVIVELIRLKKYISITSFSKNLLRESLRYGFPLIGVSLLGYIISSSDQYILLYYLGDTAVGNYALGYRLVDATIINFLTLILLVMTPELNFQHDEFGSEKSQSILKNMISAAVWCMLPLTFAIIVYAEHIIYYFFPAYTDASHIMQLVTFASLFHGLSMFTCKGLELVKKSKYIFYGLLIAALVNALYNFIFIPIYGIDASAHSSLFAYIIYNIILLLFTKRYYRIQFDWKYLIKVCFNTFVTVICAFIMMEIFPINNLIIFIIEVIVCMFIYIVISYIVGLIDVIVK